MNTTKFKQMNENDLEKINGGNPLLLLYGAVALGSMGLGIYNGYQQEKHKHKRK